MRCGLAVGMLAFTLLASCRSEESSQPPPIILVVLDTTRADHLSIYGSPNDTTPNLRRILEGESVRFTDMVSASNNTYCSHASLFTGLHVKSHGVSRVHPGFTPLSAELDTLAEILHEGGYATLGAVSSSHINPEYSGFGQGFDEFVICPRTDEKSKRPSEETNAELLPALRGFVARSGDRPLFLFLHYFDAHMYYDPPDRFNKFREVEVEPWPDLETTGFELLPQKRNLPRTLPRQRALYDGEILRSDDSLARVFESLGELGILEKAVIVVTADHGENLGEHGLYYDHSGLYQPVIRTPLLVRVPGITTRRTSPALVHHVDLMPTLLEAARIPRDRWPHMEGESLFPLLRGEKDTASRTYAFSEAVQVSEKMVRDGRYKLIVDAHLRCFLFDLETDPAERNDLSSTLPGKRDELLGHLLSFMGQKTWLALVKAPEDADGVETLTGHVESPMSPVEVEPVGLGDGDSLDGSGKRVSFRLVLSPGQSKGLRITSAYGPLLFRVASDRHPAELLYTEVGNDRQTVFPLTIGPPDPDTDPARAPATLDPLVVVERLPADGSRGMQRLVRLLPTDGRLSVRVSTTGRFAEVRRTRGRLVRRDLGAFDTFRAESASPEEEAAFLVRTVPDDALLLLDGKLDREFLPATRFRLDDRNDPRSYPVTFAATPDAVLPEVLPGTLPETVAPGFHLYLEKARDGRISTSPEMIDMLEELGYLEKSEDRPRKPR